MFDDGNAFHGPRSTAQTRKAWMNRMLEEATVPTFWLSNSIDSVDPAFLRRFDMVIKLPIPPRKQRQRILERECQAKVGKECIARIAESENLSPAIISRSASVIHALGNEVNQPSAERALEYLISNALEAQGHARLIPQNSELLPSTYDPRLLNPDSDISAMTCGLKETRSGRLCFYGPPGTGKTAFGRWLALQLDIPLYVRRGSDLISPYIGMTERNIASAFQEASQEGALLMIDEIDGFLRDRTGAQRPWEITGVNEMLTQMEAFSGVFVTSTNLMDGLDPAALRRFDAKVHFAYLKPQQSVALFRANCLELELGEPNERDEAVVARMGKLAPGDFAALMRRHRFCPIRSPGHFVELLSAEVLLKNGSSRPIGFVH